MLKMPEMLETKEWLMGGQICGLKLNYRIVGTESTKTDWVLERRDGEVRVFSSYIKYLVDVEPDWVVVLRVKSSVREEVIAWREYASKEATDLTEYERLKLKFDD